MAMTILTVEGGGRLMSINQNCGLIGNNRPKLLRWILEMSKLPHSYTIAANFEQGGGLTLGASQLPEMTIAPPIQFGGPGDIWSPEDLQVAALSSCLILSFKAVALAAGLEWLKIECDSEGILGRNEGQIYFTSFTSTVKLTIKHSSDSTLAEGLVHKADETCFVSNSLKATTALEVRVFVAE